MPKIVKTTDVPADPKRLYIYLYCDKLGCYKSTTKKKAAQSWLSLSESKRRRFLKTCRLKKDLDTTQRVLSTEPFLKPLYNSTVEDISRGNKDDEQNKSCLDGDNEVQNQTYLDNSDGQQNEKCLPEQQLDNTYLDNNNIQQNEKDKADVDKNNGQQNEPCLANDDVQQNETCLNLDDDNERQSITCLENDNNDNEEQNNLVVPIVNTYLDNNKQQNESCLANDDVQQNETCLNLDDDNERQSITCSENDNNDNEEQNNFVVPVVNEKDQQRDKETHLDVNSICREINGSDSEALPNTEEQNNQGTAEDGQENSKGFINNIKEPIPPTVKNWRELFEFLNKGKNKNYKDVSVTEKYTYQTVCKKIRNEYIEKYIQYLESLTDEELYEHYLKG